MRVIILMVMAGKYTVCSICLSMTPSHLFNGSDWLLGVISERHTGYAHNRILPVGSVIHRI